VGEGRRRRGGGTVSWLWNERSKKGKSPSRVGEVVGGGGGGGVGDSWHTSPTTGGRDDGLAIR
jgi:hypothetical protein